MYFPRIGRGVMGLVRGGERGAIQGLARRAGNAGAEGRAVCRHCHAAAAVAAFYFRRKLQRRRRAAAHHVSA